MKSHPDFMTLKFRCPQELDGRLPLPFPAVRGLPDWFKTMPQQAFNPLASIEDDTVNRRPPFIDAMTTGFLIPLICDVKVENGEFTWDNDLPPARGVAFERSPIGFHPSSQVIGSPLFDPDRFLIKFHNLWTIEAPAGYSLLFTHRANRFDLPFTTLSGVVDCDRYGNTGRRIVARRNCSSASSPRPAAFNAMASRVSVPGSWLRRAVRCNRSIASWTRSCSRKASARMRSHHIAAVGLEHHGSESVGVIGTLCSQRDHGVFQRRIDDVRPLGAWRWALRHRSPH